ncbi:conserved hypothetical protein [Beutenbergia cavernae DSM 12333]|uniref:Glycoside hydrolase 123 catalytic domain-containing protein n=1 Tax=Beutenbergia cavernae (strain ATCC BAA-8 / DSM 12333 / CCUG 43141 / JCM 11478 / NBRC 16432 / NCIMB 13614 / HKI 0122) TaxID=471853 RepID=C5C5B8_BEUC1|nr:DUF4091 domain-containing protein [Beutenbergia cavernae]ACQ82258.1 conserved hypothetical protein [Beutenbergia cavernae DSM 12333]
MRRATTDARPYPRPDWTFVLADSLEKVFPDVAPRPMSRPELSGFLGEALAVQLAFLPPAAHSPAAIGPVTVRARGELAHLARLSTVELVPCQLPAFDGHDDGYLRDTPGLYPDLLRPIEQADAGDARAGAPGAVDAAGLAGTLHPRLGYWQAVWVDLQVDDPALAGRRTLTLEMSDADGKPLHTAELAVVVHPVALPALDIVNMHWLHADSLLTYYGVDAFSEEHWRLLEEYVASAAAMRANSLLTPTWTPPLDTAIGGTRPPVQLVGISDDDGGAYAFDFSRLGRWLALCKRHGITTLEVAHLFTQWGATATPAIYVETPSGTEQRFGWHVPATDPSYRELLASLLPALRGYLAEHWSGDVIFHVSDEPRPEMLSDYREARAVVDDLLDGATIADALSDLAFAQDGVVDTPIVATNHVQPFLDAGMTPWVYYCVSQNRDVANRFIALPSVRNRVLGRQLFAFSAPGFLHWGFNFWFAQHSTRPIDPHADTSAGGAFPSGDPFIVYPGPNGEAWPSLRHRVFAQAMDDHRALQLLRTLTDQATARSYVDEGGALAYDAFTYDPEHYLETRRAVDARILAELAGARAT